MDQVEKIIAYENGELSEQEIVDLFQELIDSGLAWKFQGHHGRVAKTLLNNGYCRLPKER